MDYPDYHGENIDDSIDQINILSGVRFPPLTIKKKPATRNWETHLCTTLVRSFYY